MGRRAEPRSFGGHRRLRHARPPVAATYPALASRARIHPRHSAELARQGPGWAVWAVVAAARAWVDTNTAAAPSTNPYCRRQPPAWALPKWLVVVTACRQNECTCPQQQNGPRALHMRLLQQPRTPIADRSHNLEDRLGHGYRVVRTPDFFVSRSSTRRRAVRRSAHITLTIPKSIDRTTIQLRPAQGKQHVFVWAMAARHFPDRPRTGTTGGMPSHSCATHIAIRPPAATPGCCTGRTAATLAKWRAVRHQSARQRSCFSMQWK